MNCVEFFLKEGFLISPDFKDKLGEINENFIEKIEERIKSSKPVVINHDFFLILNHSEANLEVNWNEFEKSRTLLEKGKNGKLYVLFLDLLNYNLSEDKKKVMNEIFSDVEENREESVVEDLENSNNNVIVLSSYNKESKERKVEDFVYYFKNRYNSLKNVLRNRQELMNPISIGRLYNKKNREVVSIIGMVSDKSVTKNGNLLLKLEDLTGEISVLISKDKEVFNLAKSLVLDEVIGINGVMGNKIIFVNDLVFPDVSSIRGLKKTSDDVYAAFTGDMHVGSKLFLEEDFMRFVKWINGERGDSKQREMARKVKYLFLVGDAVAGVGIYPGQEEDLIIKDVREQYGEVARLLSLIRRDVKIIVCPGNHDAVRISEPQPVIDQSMAKSLWSMRNVYMVSNPCLINIHSSKDFIGFDVLMYHAYCFDYYAANVDEIREKGGYDAADEIMAFLLKRRHLAPTHASTLYIPEIEEDPLFIKKVPDIFVTGHVHRMRIGNYKNVTTICSSCWESKTEFQERTGHNPQPSRVPIVSLKTRDVRVLRFDLE